MWWPRGTWQRARRTRLRKGVRVGWRVILEVRVGERGAGGAGEEGREEIPMAERMSGWVFWGLGLG